jgi:hypothetical protein
LPHRQDDQREAQQQEDDTQHEHCRSRQIEELRERRKEQGEYRRQRDE